MLSLITQTAFSSILTQKGGENQVFQSQQVPFFKSPQSLFPSGSVSIEELKRLQIKTTLAQEKFYKWNSRLFKADELKPIRPLHLARFVIDAKTKQRFQVIETSVGLLKIFDAKKKKTIQTSIDSLASDPYDTGFAITLVDAYLKKTAADDGKVLTTIPQGFRLTAQSYKNGFAEVTYKNYSGFVRLSEVVTKFDLATVAFSGDKWQFIKKREFDWLITNDDKKIHLSTVRGLVTPDSRGLIASANQKIPLWSQVELVSETTPSWIESSLKGHGSVWWKPTSKIEEDIYTIDELLKKEISSVSFHPKNPLKGILSAHGVYMTDDGYHWKKLQIFADFNGPVYYFNDLLVFVGPHRSVDGGRHFENYIQIDKIASAIEYSLGFFPKRLQVKHIETKAPFRLKIEVETGFKKIKMESPLFSQDWKVVKI